MVNLTSVSARGRRVVLLAGAWSSVVWVGLALTAAQVPPRAPTTAWYRRHLPVTIRVNQDVTVTPGTRSEEERRPGTLRIYADFVGFQIKKGQTFQMIKLLGEGACRIRFARKTYDLECPWLEGFARRETDIYVPVAAN